MSVKTIDYVLDGNSVLFDTVGNNGLDKVYDVSESSVTLSINTGGVVSKHTVAAYTVDNLIAAARYSRATTPLP